MRRLNRWLAIGLLLTCLNASANELSGSFTPQQLFAGDSDGNGSLKMLFGKPKPFHVKSRGQLQPGGSFRLDQTITFEGETPKDRTWILENATPGTYAGTLSDAPGKVSGRNEGNRLILRYRIKGPLLMQQTLELMADGKTIDNAGKITLLGLPIGKLHETIIRNEPSAQHARDSMD